MRKKKRNVKDWLIWGSIISILVILFILALYLKQTYRDFINGQVDWGNFGGLLGAITGLIAFVGVLFTLRQNKQQFLNSEDRAVFFDLLRIFISYRDALQVKRIDWVYDNRQCKWKITPYNELCTPEKTYRQIYVELYHTFYLEIRRGIPNNFSKEEFTKKIIPPNISREQWMLTYGRLNTAINNIYSEHEFGIHGGMSTTFPIHINFYDYLCLNVIKIYFEQNNFQPIAEACAKAANHCLAPYKNQLGAYFRNAFYILEMVSEFSSSNKYSKIFRAQLSKYELVLLFFNSFSSLSNSRTRELYLKADLFNNLELKDVRLKEGVNDESVSRMEYQNFPPVLSQTVVKNEYISCDLLKKIYDSIQI